MLTTTAQRSDAASRPLTHRECLVTGQQMAAGRADAGAPWVQVLRYHREGSYVLCGQVVELGSGDAEWFKVDTTDGPLWAMGRNVRLCSGDGRCTCEPAPAVDTAPLPVRTGTDGQTDDSTDRATTQATGEPSGLPGICQRQPTGQSTR